SHHQPEEPPHQPAPHPFIPPFPGAAPEPVSREPVPPRAGSSRLSPGAAWDLAGDDGAAAAPVQHPIVSSTPSIPRGETPQTVRDIAISTQLEEARRAGEAPADPGPSPVK